MMTKAAKQYFDLTGRSALITGATRGIGFGLAAGLAKACLLYTSPSPRDDELSRMPSSA